MLSYSGDIVTPIDTATNTAGPPIAVQDATQIAITPDGKTAYVSDPAGDAVIPIDTATNTAGTPIQIGRAPAEIAITPDGTTAYVIDQGHPVALTPIATATNTAGTPILLGVSLGTAIAITP